MKDIWAYLVGYFYSLVVGQIFIGVISNSMYGELGLKNRSRGWHSMVLGYLERALFISTLLVGMPEFIAIWLGLKTAGGWKHWSEEYWTHTGTDGKEFKVLGRNVFNSFLVAQALTIVFAGVGWKSIVLFISEKPTEAISLLIGSTLGVLIVLIIVKYQCRNKK